jgi:hypothetical protein
VVVCDWHYERADATPVYFAMKGFRVLVCPWNRPEVSREQLELLDGIRDNSPLPLKDRYFGFMQTAWGSAGGFMEAYYAAGDTPVPGEKSEVACFKLMMNHYRNTP